MCLLVFSFNSHKDYKLILAENRDEFYNRKSIPANFWENNPNILAGYDLKSSGTWLGINKNGKFSTITNYRNPFLSFSISKSRGELVKNFLYNSSSPEEYIEEIKKDDDNYKGYNIILYDLKNLFYYSNKGKSIKLNSGIYGLSNHLLDTKWPKVKRSKRMFRKILNDNNNDLVNSLFNILNDNYYPWWFLLPNTGVGKKWEKILSPIFVKSKDYGTISSTVLLIDKKNNVTFVEKTYKQGLEYLTNSFNFKISEQK